MTKEQLKAKLDRYAEMKADIEVNSYSAEIEEKVAAYRASVEAEYQERKAVDLAKIDNYIALLNDLINEEEEAEVAAEQREVESGEETVNADSADDVEASAVPNPAVIAGI